MEVSPDVFWILAIMIACGAAFVFVVATAQQSRRHFMTSETRVCRGCGESHPGFARFCRQCGRKL